MAIVVFVSCPESRKGQVQNFPFKGSLLMLKTFLVLEHFFILGFQIRNDQSLFSFMTGKASLGKV